MLDVNSKIQGFLARLNVSSYFYRVLPFLLFSTPNLSAVLRVRLGFSAQRSWFAGGLVHRPAEERTHEWSDAMGSDECLQRCTRTSASQAITRGQQLI